MTRRDSSMQHMAIACYSMSVAKAK